MLLEMRRRVEIAKAELEMERSATQATRAQIDEVQVRPKTLVNYVINAEVNAIES
jgi:hypothetical protein